MEQTLLKQPSLLDRMPKVRGRVRENVMLSESNWFQVGGPAEILFKPDDVQDLAHFLKEKPKDIPVTVIGVGSNLLVRDGGLKGVVIRLGRGFAEIKSEGDLLHAGAGALDVNVAWAAEEQSLTGLEFLSGIPGTIGGALRMNAGAYGSDLSQVLVEAQAVDSAGEIHTLSLEEMQFTYRHAGIPHDWIFTRATLRGTPGDRKTIAERIHKIAEERASTQPVRARTGGSTFKNPEGHKAWELIDAAGCRGLAMGAAQVSDKHCNFLINNGSATAHELESLGEEVRKRVYAHSGIMLEWEIQRIGEQ